MLKERTEAVNVAAKDVDGDPQEMEGGDNGILEERNREGKRRELGTEKEGENNREKQPISFIFSMKGVDLCCSRSLYALLVNQGKPYYQQDISVHELQPVYIYRRRFTALYGRC
jgi:hypothetical protein